MFSVLYLRNMLQTIQINGYEICISNAAFTGECRLVVVAELCGRVLPTQIELLSNSFYMNLYGLLSR